MKLYGLAELASAVGVTTAKLGMWMRRGHVPPPDWRLSCGPVWNRETVSIWIISTRRRLDLNQPIVDR